LRDSAVRSRSVTRGVPRSETSVAIRQRKVREAELQLAKFATCSNSQTNSQTQRNIPLQMAGSKTMIAPGARDAPKFSSRKPQELRRFLRTMEDAWNDAGIVTDAEKKESIGKYADAESEEEWTAFETFEAGHTWEEFKAELIENYPEAAAAERGTPARIKQICVESKGVRLGDIKAVYALRRAFMAEAKKLVKPPAVMSNRELVELFIGCLSEQMGAAVLQALGNTTAAQSKPQAGSLAQASSTASTSASAVSNVVSRRPEDKYDLEEVMKAAIQVSENSQGMFYLLSNYTKEPAVIRCEIV